MEKRAQEEEKKLLVDQRTQLVREFRDFSCTRWSNYHNIQSEADEMAFADAALKSVNNKAA